MVRLAGVVHALVVICVRTIHEVVAEMNLKTGSMARINFLVNRPPDVEWC